MLFTIRSPIQWVLFHENQYWNTEFKIEIQKEEVDTSKLNTSLSIYFFLTYQKCFKIICLLDLYHFYNLMCLWLEVMVGEWNRAVISRVKSQGIKEELLSSFLLKAPGIMFPKRKHYTMWFENHFQFFGDILGLQYFLNGCHLFLSIEI